MIQRRKTGKYFKQEPGWPKPVAAVVKRRVSFSEVDAMAIVWHGRYPQFFEEGYAALSRKCGLGYADFYAAQLRAPIVQFHVDYFQSLFLEEEFAIEARLVWSEGARIHIEYTLIKQNGAIAAAGYTVQMLTTQAGEVCLVAPPLIEACRKRWLKGEFGT